MQIAIHLFTIFLLCAVFQLGSMISQRSDEWSIAIDPESGHYQALRKSFLLSGKIIQLGAFIWALMNVIALLPLLPRV
ncbi:MAG: hypothetical protein ACP5M4_10040 [Acidobacteriaceae bacterium]